MAKYEITAPDGSRYEVEAPDGATEQDALEYFKRQNKIPTVAPAREVRQPGAAEQQPDAPSFNFDRSADDVWADINAMPEGDARNKLISQWGDRAFQEEQKQIEDATPEWWKSVKKKIPGMSGPSTTGVKGILGIGGLVDEGQAVGSSLVNTLTGGYMGRPYERELAMIRARDRDMWRRAPVASTLKTLGTGIVSGTPLSKVPVPKHWVPRVGANLGLAGLVGGWHGFTEGEGGFDRRLRSGAESGAISAALALPFVAGGEIGRGIRHGRMAVGKQGAMTETNKRVDANQLTEDIARGPTNTKPSPTEIRGMSSNERMLRHLGREMIRHDGDEAAARNAAIQRYQNSYGTTRNTAQDKLRDIENAHRDSNLLLGEYPSVARADAAMRGSTKPANVDRRQLGRIEYDESYPMMEYVANQPGKGRTLIRNKIGLRNEQLKDDVRGLMDRIGPRRPVNPDAPDGRMRPATVDDVPEIVDAAKRASQAEYDAALLNGGQTDHAKLQSEIPKLLDKIKRRLGWTGPTQDGGRKGLSRPILEKFLDELEAAGTDMNHLKEARSVIGKVMFGNSDDAALAKHVFGDHYNELTKIMGEANPGWLRANNRWRDMQLLDFAKEVGETFKNRAGVKFREQMDEFNKMAPEAQEIVKIYLKQNVLDILDNLPSDTIRSNFQSDHWKKMIDAFFGKEALNDYTRAIRNQEVAQKTLKALGGSPTQPRQEMAKEMNAPLDAKAAADWLSLRGLAGKGLDMASSALGDNRNTSIAKYLSTPLSDTANVARELAELRRNVARARRLRAMRPRLPRTAVGISTIAGRNAGEVGRARLQEEDEK